MAKKKTVREAPRCEWQPTGPLPDVGPHLLQQDAHQRILNLVPHGAPSIERYAAVRRIRAAILYLDDAMRALADPHRYVGDPTVDAAIALSRSVFEATEIHEKVETRTAMDFVSCVRWEAECVLDRRVPIEYASPLNFLIEHIDAPPVDHAGFRRAVEAWVSYERAKRRKGGQARGQGTPDRWRPAFAALKASGLANGISSPRNLSRTWSKWSPPRLARERGILSK